VLRVLERPTPELQLSLTGQRAGGKRLESLHVPLFDRHWRLSRARESLRVLARKTYPSEGEHHLSPRADPAITCG